MIRAILFDKDGTLTDFRATWESAMPGIIADMAAFTGAAPDALARTIGFDLQAGRIMDDGLFVTATNVQTTEALARVTGWPAGRLQGWLDSRVMEVAQVPARNLGGVLADMAGRGLPMGVLTNADEAEARTHLAELGVLDAFAQVIGYDSGWGAKPDPHGALAFARGLDVAPADVLLVGDGMTDLLAARGAGMQAVAVLTGTLPAEALAPYAEAVLPDIAALPAWLDARNT